MPITDLKNTSENLPQCVGGNGLHGTVAHKMREMVLSGSPVLVQQSFGLNFVKLRTTCIW